MAKRIGRLLITVLLLLCLGFRYHYVFNGYNEYAYAEETEESGNFTTNTFSYNDIPAYKEDAYVVVNQDIPFFTEEDMTTDSFTEYGNLDELNRATSCKAVICKEYPPEDEREDISDIKPTGWVQNRYEGIINTESSTIYERCHILMWCLVGNESNTLQGIMTGTHYFNIEGMYSNENIVLQYVKYNDNHIIYRVTPHYTGNNLLADGVLIEAMSVEDKGASLSICRWAYNVQPGIEIDYRTGENWIKDEGE